MNILQALIDQANREDEEKRSMSQMTLGGLIKTLESLGEETVPAFGHPHSYRGYYSDLAFERTEGTLPASEALGFARSAMGKVFEGYKGGDYQMGERTPVWFAKYGSCGVKITGFVDGEFLTEDDE